MPQLKISGLNILLDSPSWTIHENLLRFLSGFLPTDIYCRVTFEKTAGYDMHDGLRLFRDGHRFVYSCEGSYCILNNEMDIPSCVRASSDLSGYTLYLDPEYNNPCNERNVEIIKDRLFDTIRSLMAYSLAPRKGVIVHSVAMEWQGKGILFSAPSGTGKSTHTNLWRQRYPVKIINGDNAACRIVDGSPAVYGLPWCGTSGEFLNVKVPLGAIVFLEQGKENSIVKLDAAEAIVRLYARCFLYIWEEKTADLVLETITEIVSNAECYLLKCRPDFEAVELVKECLVKKNERRIAG